MHTFTKKFIEENIDLIKENRWHEVFLNWYNNVQYVRDDNTWDDELFDELLNVLKNINLSVDITSLEDILCSEITRIINKAINDPLNKTKSVSRRYIHANLSTVFNFKASDVYKLIDKVIEELKLNRNDCGSYF